MCNFVETVTIKLSDYEKLKDIESRIKSIEHAMQFDGYFITFDSKLLEKQIRSIFALKTELFEYGFSNIDLNKVGISYPDQIGSEIES